MPSLERMMPGHQHASLFQNPNLQGKGGWAKDETKRGKARKDEFASTQLEISPYTASRATDREMIAERVDVEVEKYRPSLSQKMARSWTRKRRRERSSSGRAAVLQISP